jgi:GMP synthase-like glutamine amidotransferase
MTFGILETGEPPAALAHYGSYAAMFRELLGETAHDIKTYDVRVGDYPARAEDCAGYIVTGSACGVYEDLPWIGDLMAWLRAARERTALVGICFGHQVMAQAFGGAVIKSPRGRGVGAHRYAVSSPEPWMEGVTSFTLPAAHQDQVVVCPPGARIVASNAFSPMGMLVYEDARAFSLQLHPEFTPEFGAEMVELRRGKDVSEEAAEQALASLKGPMDRALVAGWIRRCVEA